MPANSKVPTARTDRCYRMLASKIQAYHHCKARNNEKWLHRHADGVQQIAKDILPRGSGVDSGCTIDLDECSGDKIIIHTAFHHMDEGGGYNGWTEHRITVRPSLVHDFTLTISGRNRNGIKEYLSDLFSNALAELVLETYDPTTDTTAFRIN